MKLPEQLGAEAVLVYCKQLADGPACSAESKAAGACDRQEVRPAGAGVSGNNNQQDLLLLRCEVLLQWWPQAAALCCTCAERCT